MTAAQPSRPSTPSRGSVGRGVRAARGADASREGRSSDAYAMPMLGRALALRSLVGLTGEGAEARTCWIHVAYQGTWEGHPDGAFTLDAAAFASCVAAFEAQRNPVPVDYEHASVRDVLKAPAAGWVQRLETRDDGDLWAFVEWTAEAAAEIRSGAYRYCSGVFVFERPDRKSGEPVACSLHSIALTNTPFIDGQKPIALSQRRVALSSHTEKQMEITRDALLEALGKLEGDALTTDQLHKLIEAVSAMTEAQDPDAGAEEVPAMDEPAKDLADKDDEEEKALADAPAEEVAAEESPGDDPAALLAEFEAIAAQMGKDLPALLAYLQEMLAAGAGESAAANPAALSAEVAALKTTVASYGKQLAVYRKRDEAEAKAKVEAGKRALSAEVDAMVASGRIVKADAKAWRELALADAGRFRALAATLKPAVPTGREASAVPAGQSQAQALDADTLDKSDPRIVALFDRFRTGWRVTDEKQLESLVRKHLEIERQNTAG
jgi:hypothetical protein